MRWTIVQLSPKRQMSEHRSNTIYAVVERPDHHCGVDLGVVSPDVNYPTNMQWWPDRWFCVNSPNNSNVRFVTMPAADRLWAFIPGHVICHIKPTVVVRVLQFAVDEMSPNWFGWLFLWRRTNVQTGRLHQSVLPFFRFIHQSQPGYTVFFIVLANVAMLVVTFVIPCHNISKGGIAR